VSGGFSGGLYFLAFRALVAAMVVPIAPRAPSRVAAAYVAA
jgi:hypothetical protein